MSSGTVAHTQGRVSYVGAFAGLMLRDLRVLRREIGPFVVRIIMQPLLFLFVFTFLFPRNGQMGALGGAIFATVLLPGLMAVAIMFSGIAAVALPLSQEFGITREIDDRVMCPLPVAAVAAEKVVFSAIQSILAALLVLPLAIWVPATPVYAHVASWPMLIATLILASLVARLTDRVCALPGRWDWRSGRTYGRNRSGWCFRSWWYPLRFWDVCTIPGRRCIRYAGCRFWCWPTPSFICLRVCGRR